MSDHVDDGLFTADDEEREAQLLRDEWARLSDQGVELRRATSALGGSTNRMVLSAHATRLREFSTRLRAFHVALDRFHDAYDRGAGLPTSFG